MSTKSIIDLLHSLNNCSNNDKILIKTVQIIFKMLYENDLIYFVDSVIHLTDNSFWNNDIIEFFAKIINKYNSLYILPFITIISSTNYSKEEYQQLYYSVKKYQETYFLSIIDGKYYEPQQVSNDDMVSLELCDNIEETVTYLLNRTENICIPDMYFKKLIEPNFINFFDVSKQIPYVVAAYYPKLLSSNTKILEKKLQTNIIDFIHKSNRDFYNFFCFYLMHRTSINICNTPYYIFINCHANKQLNIIFQDNMVGIIVSADITDKLEKMLMYNWNKLSLHTTNILIELRKVASEIIDNNESCDICWIKY